MTSHATFKTLISAEELHALKNAFIIDCSFDLADTTLGEKAYAQSHIPNAMYVHLDRDLSGEKQGTPPVNGRHPLPYIRNLANHLASIGINAGQQVVAYDRTTNTNGMYAVRLWWLMRWLGHEAVAVLDGGLQAWQTKGYEVTQEIPKITQGNFKASASLMSFVPKADVAANLRTKQRLVMDARAAERYRGDVEPMDPVAGHIPNAINRPFKNNLQADGTFKTREQLHAEFTALLGKYQPSEVIHQCGSGVTACHNVFAMEHAGLHGALLYPGSWSEWSADKNSPVETSKA